MLVDFVKMCPTKLKTNPNTNTPRRQNCLLQTESSKPIHKRADKHLFPSSSEKKLFDWCVSGSEYPKLRILTEQKKTLFHFIAIMFF